LKGVLEIRIRILNAKTLRTAKFAKRPMELLAKIIRKRYFEKKVRKFARFAYRFHSLKRRGEIVR